MMNDLVFQGGAVGIRMNEQQYHFKGITFKGNYDILLPSMHRRRARNWAISSVSQD